MNEKYIIRYFFSASHYVVIDGNKSMKHPHTWQLEIEFKMDSAEMLNYKLVDKIIEEILEKLEGKTLNEEEEFVEIEPSTENLGRILFAKISYEFDKLNYIIKKFSISENSSRTFVLEEE